MGIFSVFQPSNDDTGDGYSRLDQCSAGSRNFRNKSFKERNSFSERVQAVENIKQKFPSKVPVIVERFKKVNAEQYDVTC